MAVGNPASDKPPLIIMILCIVFGGSLVLSLPALPVLASRINEAYGTIYAVIWGISLIATVASLIGYWLMEKWGVVVYSGAFLVGNLSGVILGIPFTFWGTVVPFVIVGVGIYYYKHMS